MIDILTDHTVTGLGQVVEVSGKAPIGAAGEPRSLVSWGAFDGATVRLWVKYRDVADPVLVGGSDMTEPTSYDIRLPRGVESVQGEVVGAGAGTSVSMGLL